MSDAKQCLTCKWWDRVDFSEPTNLYYRACSSLGKDYDPERGAFDGFTLHVVVMPKGSRVMTRNDFGCVLHREREAQA